MRLFQRSHPAFLVLALALGIVLLGESSRRPANAETAVMDPTGEILQLPVGGTGGEQALFMVNTSTRRILVYKLAGGSTGQLMLNAYRDYQYDLFLDEWPPQRGNAPSLDSKGVRKLIQDGSQDYKKAKAEKKVKDVDEFVKQALKDSKGQTVLTTVFPTGGGTHNNTDLIYLTDKANEKILVYTMQANTLMLLAARNIKYDAMIPWSNNLAQFIPWEEMKKKWEEQKAKDEKEKDK